MYPRHQLFDKSGCWVVFYTQFLEAGLLYSSRCKEYQGSDTIVLCQRSFFHSQKSPVLDFRVVHEFCIRWCLH